MASIFILERKSVPILDNFLYNWEMKNRILLILGYVPAVKQLFYNLLEMNGYWSLAIASIIVGIIYIVVLDYFIPALKLKPFHSFFIFILIFTQAVTYNFFGVANLYTPVQVSTLVFLLLGLLYFKKSLPVIIPMISGIVALLFHLGNEFILFSMLFLGVHRFRHNLSRIYDLLVFKSVPHSILVSIVFVIFPVVVIQFNLFNIHAILPDNIVRLSQIILLKNVFTLPNMLCIINKLLLSSPVGFILFIVLFRYIRRGNICGEYDYFILWLAIGGLAHNLFMEKLDLYDWDAFAWASIGYVFLGGMLYLYRFNRSKYFSYLTTILLTYSLIFFTGWIAVNAHVRPAISTFLEFNNMKNNPDALTTCFKALALQIDDSEDTLKMLKEFEEIISTNDEYTWLIQDYLFLQNIDIASTLMQKYRNNLIAKMRTEPDNYNNYNGYLSSLQQSEFDMPEKQKIIRYCFEKIVLLSPTVRSFEWYGRWSMNVGDNVKAYSLFKMADKLLNEKGSVDFLGVKHENVKLQLSIVSGRINYCAESIKYFKEAIALGASKNNGYYNLAVKMQLTAYYALGNIKKSKKILELARENNIDLEININDFRIRDQINNSTSTKYMLEGYLLNDELNKYKMLLTYATEDYNDHYFDIYWCIWYLINSEYEKLIKTSELLSKDNKKRYYTNNFIGLGYLGKKEYDTALSAFKNEIEISAYSTSAVWLVPYTMLLDGNVKEAEDWISKVKGDGTISKENNTKLIFIQLLAKIMQTKDSNVLIKKMNMTGIDISFPYKNICLPHIEELLKVSSCSDSTIKLIMKIAEKKGLTWRGIFSDFIRNTPFFEDKVAAAAFRDKEYIKFLDLLGTKDSPVYKKVDKIMNIENCIENAIFQHTQSLIVNGKNDSLPIYGKKMIQVMPLKMHGYFLLGVYKKNKGEFRSSIEYLNKAIEKISLYGNTEEKETLINRIYTIMPKNK